MCLTSEMSNYLYIIIRENVYFLFTNTHLKQRLDFWLTMIPVSVVWRPMGRATAARYSIVRRNSKGNIISLLFGLAATLFYFLCIWKISPKTTPDLK